MDQENLQKRNECLWEEWLTIVSIYDSTFHVITFRVFLLSTGLELHCILPLLRRDPTVAREILQVCKEPGPEKLINFFKAQYSLVDPEAEEEEMVVYCHFCHFVNDVSSEFTYMYKLFYLSRSNVL